MRETGLARYWVFRGETRGGKQVAWGTSAVHLPSGPVMPVLIEPPAPFTVGPAIAVGEPPPAVATSLVLADPEGEIASLALPDRRGRQGLSGRIWLGQFEDLNVIERPVSPTLHVSGNAVHEDGITNIQLQSDDSRLLGRSIALWTVVDVLSGRLQDIDYLSQENGALLTAYRQNRGWESLFSDAQAMLSQNQGAVVPWVYDPADIELLPLNESYPRFWLAGLNRSSSSKRALSRVIQEIDGSLVPVERGTPDDKLDYPIEFIAVVQLEDELGNPRTVDVRMFVQPEPPPSQVSRYIRAADRDASRHALSPPEMLRVIIEDHSEAGEYAVHDAMWTRASREAEAVYGGVCGGIFGDQGAAIREVIQHIAPICGLRIWLGVDDHLHASLAGYTFDDAERAKLALPELLEGDIFPRDTSGSPGFRTEVVGDPNDDSAGVARVSIEWSEDQRRIHPLETSSSVPVLGQGPGDADRERILSGAWIVPARGADVAGAIQAGMAGDAARVEILSHASLARESGGFQPGDMIRVSHPLGLGLPGRGWDRRLARTDRLETLPGEDAVRILLTDLGLSERMRLGLLDSVDEWVLYRAGPGEDVYISDAGSGEYVIKNVLDYVGGLPWDSGALVIWTPGASEEAHRRSWRIVGEEGSGLLVLAQSKEIPTESDVDPAFDDPIVGAGWAILRTDLYDSEYRENFIRASDKDSGMLESGKSGFQYTAY